jgi:hypothetical protein
MEQLAQATIDQVYKSKPLQGDYGEYFIYNFTVEGDKRKFSCIPNSKIDIPVRGAEVPYMEFSHSVNQGNDGKTYDNYRVSEMKVMGSGSLGGQYQDTPEAQPQPNPKPTPPRPESDNQYNSPTYFMTIAKEIMVAVISKDSRSWAPEEACNLVIDLGNKMYNTVNGVASQPSQGVSGGNPLPYGDDPHEDDSIPF